MYTVEHCQYIDTGERGGGDRVPVQPTALDCDQAVHTAPTALDCGQAVHTAAAAAGVTSHLLRGACRTP